LPFKRVLGLQSSEHLLSLCCCDVFVSESPSDLCGMSDFTDAAHSAPRAGLYDSMCTRHPINSIGVMAALTSFQRPEAVHVLIDALGGDEVRRKPEAAFASLEADARQSVLGSAESLRLAPVSLATAQMRNIPWPVERVVVGPDRCGAAPRVSRYPSIVVTIRSSGTCSPARNRGLRRRSERQPDPITTRSSRR